MTSHLLLIESDLAWGVQLTTLLEPLGTVTVVANARLAQRVLSSRHEWAAFVLDEAISEGSVFEWLAEARRTHAIVPALIVGFGARSESVNAAFDLGASYLTRPLSSRRLLAFVRSATSRNRHVAAFAETWRLRYRLSASEKDILHRAALGDGPHLIADARHTSVLTVKKQVVALLKKTTDESMAGAANRLLREVVAAWDVPHPPTSILQNEY